MPNIFCHISEIREGGWSILLRKIRTTLAPLYRLLRLIPLLRYLPLLISIYILRPLVLIRFGLLRSQNIGHFAGEAEMYLCRRDAGMDNRNAIDIFYHEAICNQQLEVMWGRILHVSPLAYPLDVINRTISGSDKHRIPQVPRGEFDIYGLMQSFPAHIAFTPEEEYQGQRRLRTMGIPEGVPFVCFHARDAEYHKKTGKKDFSFSDHRNSSICNHIQAAREMTHRGYFAIRMGAVVKEPLQTANPMIIDYATKYQNDFMDIFLGAKCYFYIGDQSGLDMIPGVFRRPLATVNLSQFQRAKTWSPDGLFITKKLWLREEHRFMTLREIFDWGIGDVQRGEQYEQLGIEPVENTPEEITALAVEMDERLKKTWQTTEEDEELQRRFWSIYKPDPLFHGVISSHIGAEFLRQNRELLGRSKKCKVTNY